MSGADILDKKRKKVHVSSPPVLISVFNKSSLSTDADIERAVEAVGVQLARDYAPIWGMAPGLEFVPKGASGSGGAPCNVSDVSDQEGAAGYHFSDASGTQIAVFCRPSFDAGSTTIAGVEAVSGCLSHECLETSCNPAANRWADGPDGRDVGLEVGDPVQPGTLAETYSENGVVLANFVYPAWFDPNAPAGSKFDHLGILRAPFTITDAGYLIVRTEPGTISDIFVSMMHPSGKATAHDVGSGVYAILGPKVPEHRKMGILWKASRRLPREHHRARP